MKIIIKKTLKKTIIFITESKKAQINLHKQAHLGL